MSFSSVIVILCCFSHVSGATPIFSPFDFGPDSPEFKVTDAVKEGELQRCLQSIPETFVNEVIEWKKGGYENAYIQLNTKDLNLDKMGASIFMCGLAELLDGHAAGFESERNGELIHHFKPKQDEENEQTSESSKCLLECHQEVAYMPHGIRPSFLILYGVNQDVKKEAETGVYDMREIVTELTDEELALTTEKAWYIGPDKASLKCGECETDEPSDHILGTPLSMFGLKENNQLDHLEFYDYDTGFAPKNRADLLNLRKKMRDIITRKMSWTKIKQGDILIINNEIGVHARKKFRAVFHLDEDDDDRQKPDRHIMRTLVAQKSLTERDGENFDTQNWKVLFPVCTKGKCKCLNFHDPEKAASLAFNNETKVPGNETEQSAGDESTTYSSESDIPSPSSAFSRDYCELSNL